MGRVLLVSNRLPVTLSHGDDGAPLVASSGGLATALRDVHERGDGRWIGYVGDLSHMPDSARENVQRELYERRLHHVPLSAQEVSLYYDGFSNAVLWPLFHYLLDKVRLEAGDEWRAYKAVNERFADAIAEELRPGDTVWIHDYQLMLLPAYLRQRAPDARIGFFLHVPWPSSDVFRILPSREEIIQGVLGADLIGFHTDSYRTNFMHSVAKVLQVDLAIDTISWEERNVRVGVYPISIDLDEFERASPAVDELVVKLRAGTGGKKTLLGVDRLDYTKGVPSRLVAFDRMLEREPQLRGKVHMIQIAVPTREKIDSYAELRSQVNELVGRINSQHGSPTESPIQFLYRTVGNDELLALYRGADVMTVTPLRDGMNLVAKEYVAARTDCEGVLMLSEFAGATSELDAALIVNPYDISAMAAAMRRALSMSTAEQRVRMNRLRAAVRNNPVQEWSRTFLEELEALEIVKKTAVTTALELEQALTRLREAAHRTFLFDYDGTLVPLAPLPDLAVPDKALLELLARLVHAPNTEVHIVSGRSRASLEEWLGDLPVSLHLEHGFWSRDASGSWTQVSQVSPDFLRRILDIMKRHAFRAPGTLVEQKSASMAFHYRGADPHVAAARLRALRAELTNSLGPNAELLEGNKVLEVRLRGVHKGTVVSRILERAPPGNLVFAAGDDRTDEDMFDALPADAVSVRIGPGVTHARFRLQSPFELRRLIGSLIP
ncbi:MAG: Alpha,alpha-trehalose-phosphate synthase [Myxococcaceae bacterium]|nr:Alpha,alpha-trehalose-phosphate synthase [Myxococcaceae bacterium]